MSGSKRLGPARLDLNLPVLSPEEYAARAVELEPTGHAAPGAVAFNTDEVLKSWLYSSSAAFSRAATLNTVKRAKDDEPIVTPDDLNGRPAPSLSPKEKRSNFMKPAGKKANLTRAEMHDILNDVSSPQSKPNPQPPKEKTFPKKRQPYNRPFAFRDMRPGSSSYMTRRTASEGDTFRPKTAPPAPKDQDPVSTSEVPKKPRDAVEDEEAVDSSGADSDPSSPNYFVNTLRQEWDNSVSGAPLRFVYLNVKGQREREVFNPYSLQVVSHAKLNTHNYFTMSSKGVTHYSTSEATFTGLDQWQREHSIFKSLVKIPFFFKFKVWRTFFYWKRFIRRTTISRHKAYLEENLFFLNPTLCGPLLEIRGFCLDIEKLPLFLAPTDVATLDSFMIVETKQKDKAARKLNQTCTRIAALLNKACRQYQASRTTIDKEVLQLKQDPWGQAEEEIRDGTVKTSTRPSSGRFNSTRERAGRKSLSIKAGTAEPAKQSYTELSQKRAECRRLTCYIRLADYMIIDSLVILSMSSVKTVLQVMEYPRPESLLRRPSNESQKLKEPVVVDKRRYSGPKDDRRSKRKLSKQNVPVSGIMGDEWREPEEEELEGQEKPVFSTQILFIDDNLVIVPNKESFESKTESLVQGFTEVITKVGRFLLQEEFRNVTSLVMMEHAEETEFGAGPDVQAMLTGQEEFKHLVLRIRDSLANAFRDVESYAAVYETFKKMYLDNRRVNPNYIREEDPTLDWFRAEMDKYKAQREDCEFMRQGRKVGLFHVDTKKLKEHFTPSPKECLDIIHELLPILAEEKNKSLLEEIAEAVDRLSRRPEDVKEFVSYLEFNTQIIDRMDELEERFETLRDFFHLLSNEKIPVSNEVLMVFNGGTVQTMLKLRMALSVAEDNKETQIRRFSMDITDKLDELRERILDIANRAQHHMIEDEESDILETIAYLTGLVNDLQDVKNKERDYTNYQEMFGVTITRLEEIFEVSRDIQDKLKIWTAFRDWEKITAEWMSTRFQSINPEEVSAQVNQYSKTVNQVGRSLPTLSLVGKLKILVDEFKLTVPVIQCLRNEALQKHHYQAIDDIVGREISKDPECTLGVLLELKVMDLKEEIQQVSNTATQEAQLEELLKKVQTTWMGGGGGGKTVEFIVNPYKDTKDVYVLGMVDDILTILEDSMVTVSTIVTSRFCTGGLRLRVEKWNEELRYISDALDKWLEFQRSWMYLESIFNQNEIARQWPQDAKLFSTVDRHWKDLMKRVWDNPSVYRVMISNLQLKEKFEIYNKQLEKIHSNLEKKLEEKRQAFPRFYFLSNDELLDILSQIKNPKAIQPNLIKCFDNIKSLEFGGQVGNDITAMISSEGEVVQLHKHPKARGEVEKWLLLLEQNMVLTLKQLAKVAVTEYPKKPRTEWIFEHPVQLVLTVAQIFWCKEVVNALSSENPVTSMMAFRDTCYDNLGKIAAVTANDLTPVERGMVTTLITCDVHARDLMDQMVDDGVCKVMDFGWRKQLRFEWTQDDDGNGDVAIKQNNTTFIYGYEFLGCQSRLVVTPLTDRIYMTLTGALHLRLGGSPAGPAGTGKTETVKDLAKGLARHCVVYNCSDGVTYKMMEKFFSGLVQAGAWCCLDEFNRINIEVLSVIASQLTEIRQAMLQKATTFVFQGVKDIPIRYTYGAFITMNPTYAGRTELPDNLKVLFRPVAVMTPDFRMIAEVILFSEGFQDAKSLSLKMTQLYKLSSEQLSPQDHYDFGMRALKSILVMAGGLKRGSPDIPENLTLIRACLDSNLPKFVAEDIPLFNGIVSDLFPGVETPAQDYGELQKSIETDLKAHTFQVLETFCKKVLQFYETLVVRHGVMLVGPTGGGKTTNRTTLANSLTALHRAGSPDPFAQPVHEYTLNPKSISYGELYGRMNPLTQDWTDGVLVVLVKEILEDTTDDHKWIIFDGPVDTLWIESMNSVLDDSKLLCLDNGLRMKLNGTIHMIFEVQDLAVASPATVSRCGMVYMDPVELGWRPVVASWLDRKIRPLLAEESITYLESLFDNYCQPGLDFIKKECTQLIPAMDINMIQSLCDLWLGIMQIEKVPLTDPTPHDEIKDYIRLVFLFTYVWTIGGNFNQRSQEAFDGFIREHLETVFPFPGFGLCYDFQIDFKNRKLASWETTVPEFVYNPKTPYFEILVPTIDTVRYSYLLNTLTSIQKPSLLNGQTGVGKSVIIQNCLREGADTLDIIPVTIQFSAQTSATRTQEMIEMKLKTRRKNQLGAPHGKTVVLFIDDLNMPTLEVFGASPPAELLRQMISQGGFYDRKNLFWKYILDVNIVAACGPPEGGRNPIHPRLVRQFHLLQISNLGEDSMRKIFSSILSGFFSPFHRDVQNLVKPMVNGSVEIYLKIKEDLRPRPSKAHYTFNLRDLSKVFQGIMMVVPRSCANIQQGIHLWIHENMRCFHDRLVNQEDRRYFTEELVMDVLKRTFPGCSQATHENLFEGPPIVWCDFLHFGAPAEEKLYEEIPDPKRLPRLFDEYLDEYNVNTNTHMNLVFFKDHCEHLVRICRILRQPRGNALLVGVGGCGKQSLTKLASAIVEYKFFQVEVKKNYNMQQFHEDLGELYHSAGVEDFPVTFLFSDTQIVDEGMVEDINNILNSGDVPNLFPQDEKDKKINACIEDAREAGIGGSRDSIYNFFISRVRDNLHIVLCMSPVGDAFRRRCRQFPSLVNCCTIDWFDEWPTQALLSVALRLMEDVDFDDRKLAVFSETCVEIHSTVAKYAEKFFFEHRRHFYVTPTSYLEFLSLFITVLEEKEAEVGQATARIRNGKQKMKETNEEVDSMQEALTNMQPRLEESRVKTEEMMVELSIRKTKVNDVREVVAAQKADAADQQMIAQALQTEAKRDLDEALPELEASLRALESLNKSDIGEIRGYTKAPLAVEKTMAAVMIILKEPKNDWDSAKAALGNPNFLQRLKDYDKDSIPAHVISKLKRFIDDPHFTPEKVGVTGSAACKSLCMWCHAIDLYYRVSKNVAPKKAALEQAQGKLDEMNSILEAAQDKLQEVEDELEQLQEDYDQSVTEKQDLEYNIDLSSKRLAAASQLTSSLAAEVTRWDSLLEVLEGEIETLPLNTFLSSACIAYCGAFTAEYREMLVKEWSQIMQDKGLGTLNFSLISTMSTPMQIREWNIMSLPSDTTSIENAILADTCTSKRSRRWPLMIDPQGQALRWIQKMEGKNGLKAVKQTDPNYLRTLEQAIRNGTPLVIEDLGETLDPALEPVLLKQVYTQNGRALINLGGASNAIDYDSNFRFYLTTKLANPHYLPDVCIKVTLINFTVTLTGLQDQILGDVVGIEEAELEESKNRIIQSVATDQRKLKQYEDSILEELESVSGNILDNAKVIESLKKTQTTSDLLSTRLAEAEEKSKSINEARSKYRPAATRASILYFVVADLARISPMYQYSLDHFKKLFTSVIRKSKKHADFEIHLRIRMDGITEAVYHNICRGLFKKHKIVFSFLMAVQILRQAGVVSDLQWQFLLRPTSFLGQVQEYEPNPCSWLPETTWQLMQVFEEKMPVFRGICHSIAHRSKEWCTYYQRPDIQTQPFPDANQVPEPKDKDPLVIPTFMDAYNGPWLPDWNKSLSRFEKLLLLRALREEKILFGIHTFVLQEMGQQFIEQNVYDLPKVVEETTVVSPILFVLSTGADPASGLFKYTRTHKIGLKNVSLGQGQEETARRMIEDGKSMGDWVLLQNCHLGKSFMPELEKQVTSFSHPTTSIHKKFRLWLTSMPTDFFPIPVLQNCVKLTTEPPSGMRANLIRCYADIEEVEFFQGTEGNVPSFPECTKSFAYKKLLYGLCFFQSVIQERKKFGALGWNVKYEFNDTDLEVSKQWLKMFLEEEENVPWDSLLYMVGEINYGGRVTDPWDRRALLCILRNYYNPEILLEDFKFTPSGSIGSPKDGDLAFYRRFVESLPMHDDPEVFGMHENANIRYQHQESHDIMSTILFLQPRASGGGAVGGMAAEQIVNTKAKEILEALPDLLLLEEAGPYTFRTLANGLPNSLSTVLLHETVKFNKLLRVMRETLVELQKAIQGLTVLSEALDKMFTSFLNNEVPGLWSDIAYESLKPLASWIHDLETRVSFVRLWLRKGEPACYWMSGLFYPHGFITGILQGYSRQFQVPVDTLSFSFNVRDCNASEITKPPEAGVYVSGLFADSYRWDWERKCMEECHPGTMYSKMPVIHFLPQVAQEKSDEYYTCPLYKTSVRAGVLSSLGQSTNFIVAVDLPSSRPSSFWIQQGAALLCQLDD